MVERLFLTMPRGCLQFVIVVFPDHTHLLFFIELKYRCLQTRQADLKNTQNISIFACDRFLFIKKQQLIFRIFQ